MRILLCSYVFAPSIGGIETVSSILADQFSRLGSTVTVVTDTPGPQVTAAYDLVRLPSMTKLYQLSRDSDIALQNNISMRTIFPLLLSRKPVAISHHTWLTRTDGRRGWQDHLKLATIRKCHNIAISQAISSALPVKSVIIGDPFEPGEFQNLGKSYRVKDIVFMGRLVSDKGCDLVLRALGILKAEGIRPSLSIIGDGPEMPALKRKTAELGLSAQVSFRGILREGRGREVAQHKIMVVPSTWKEPFGVVALEGIAAGCVVVASRAGGLPEAVGPCGILFPSGDAGAMARAIQELLASPPLREKLLLESGRHLQRFQPEAVARTYLGVFESALQK
jgi:glycogen(starch) synthase